MVETQGGGNKGQGARYVAKSRLCRRVLSMPAWVWCIRAQYRIDERDERLEGRRGEKT